jgi:hypothetical protein
MSCDFLTFNWLSRNYLGDTIFQRSVDSKTIQQFILPDNHIFVHHVMAMQTYERDKTNKKWRVKHSIPNQYDIARLLGELSLYDNTTAFESFQPVHYFDLLKRQWKLGISAALHLFPVMNANPSESPVARTVFAEHLSTLQQHFQAFGPASCRRQSR